MFVANGNGSNPRQLLRAGTPPNVNIHGAAGAPRWSNDESQIAYGEVRQQCDYSYITCTADGQPCTKSPCRGTAIIRVVVSDGTAEQLTPPNDFENPAWSPNDHWLAFNPSGADGGIWRVRDDGTCLTRIAGNLRLTRDAPTDAVWRPGAGSPTDACS